MIQKNSIALKLKLSSLVTQLRGFFATLRLCGYKFQRKDAETLRIMQKNTHYVERRNKESLDDPFG